MCCPMQESSFHFQCPRPFYFGAFFALQGGRIHDVDGGVRDTLIPSTENRPDRLPTARSPPVRFAVRATSHEQFETAFPKHRTVLFNDVSVSSGGVGDC